MACKYFAPNGEPSKMFNDLYDHYSQFYNTAQAEKLALSGWLFARSGQFKSQYGDWTKSDTSISTEQNKSINDLKSIETIKEFKEFAEKGNTNSKNTFDISLDENGEPKVAIVNSNNEMVAGYILNNSEVIPFEHNEIKSEQSENRNVNMQLQGENVTDQIAKLQSQGLEIKNVRQKDGDTFIAGTADIDNLFFNDDVLEKKDAVPVRELMLEKDNAADILKRIIRNPEIEENKGIAVQIAISNNKQPQVTIMSREQINEAYPEVAQKAAVNMFYDPENHKIVINGDININPTEFESVMLEEIIHANTVNQLRNNEDVAKQWNAKFESSKAAFKEAGIVSRFMVNDSEFLYGILTNKQFRQALQNTIPKGETNSVFDDVFNFIMRLFGIRKSMSGDVQDMLNMANSILKRSLADTNSSAMADVVKDDTVITDAPVDVESEEIKAAHTTVDVEGLTESFGGSTIYDKYLLGLAEKLSSLRAASKGKGLKKTEVKKLRSETAVYNRDRRDLESELNYATLLRVAASEVQLMINHLPTTNTISGVSESLRMLKDYGDLAFDMARDAADNGLEMDKEMQDLVDDVAAKANKTWKEYYEKYFQVFKQKAEEMHAPPNIINGINIDMSINDIGGAAANFIGLSYGQNQIEKVSDFLIRRSANLSNNEWLDFDKELEERLKPFGKNIDFMFRKDADGNSVLGTKYSQELYDKMQKLGSEIKGFEVDRRPMLAELKRLTTEYNAAKVVGNVNLMNDLSDQKRITQGMLEQNKKDTKSWDDYYEFMREHFDFEASYTEEDWEEWQDILRSSFEDKVGLNGAVNEYAYDAELSKSDPERFKNWLKTGKDRPSDASRWFKAKPKEIWYNNTFFTGLSTEQKEFYDWFTDKFVKAHENIPQDDPSFGEYDMDKIIRNFTFNTGEGLSKLKYLSKELKSFAKGLVTTSYSENANATNPKGALTGEETGRLVFKNINSVINKKDGYITKDKITPAVQKLIDAGTYKINDKGFVIYAKSENVKGAVGPDSKPINTERLVEYTAQETTDPIHMFKDFIKFSINYKYKRSVEDLLNSANEIASDRPVVQTTSDGRTKMRFGNTFIAKGKNNVAERLKITNNAYLYDDRKDKFAGPNEPGQTKVSGEQIIETINNFTRARQLGFNIASGITNLAMGTIGNYQYAGRDEFFNEKELGKAYWVMKSTIAKLGTANKYAGFGDAEKILTFIKRFSLFGNFQEELFEQGNSLTKMFSHMFVTQKGGEYMNQGATMIAMMMRQKIKNLDGTAFLKDGKEVSVWDSMDVHDGKIIHKYAGTDFTNPERLMSMGNAINQVNKEIHGDYDPLNFMAIKKKQYGRILMNLRSWLPMAIKTRLGEQYEDSILSEFKGETVSREGRWNTFGRYMFQKNDGNRAINLFKFTGAVMASTIGVIPGMDSKISDRILESMGVTKADAMNMKQNIKEAWWLMAISVFGAMLKNGIDDDDDDGGFFGWNTDKALKKQIRKLGASPDVAKENFLTYLFNQSARIDNDLWFYYSPVALQKVIREPVAIGSTLKQMVRLTIAAKNYVFDHDSDTYKTGHRKGKSKLLKESMGTIPGLRQVDATWSMWSQIYKSNPGQ